MGLEFMPIFEEWAVAYDDEVNGGNPEYQEVFANYWQILDEITAASGEVVLEFGSGTGNLTEKLITAGKTVYPVEPSPEMRNIAAEKAALRETTFFAGDMENFPMPAESIDTIASNLVFHHLTTEEKARAIQRYSQLLTAGGKIIFGDTMFLSQKAYTEILATEKAAGRDSLAADLEREYYPVMSELEELFRMNGFQTRYQQMNRFVWLVIAEKIMEAE
ncbi:class I SAM-dependent methyltransferase [Enterococcus sp.]|uniref:class I SAM-dependent methyltransferase n=1 Tax=Enterococcus sp. TaxID=35783 RepID=UPI002906A8FB|nr:class I SAM-dependent methyltransferase [Enterococcus sp.]MDU5336703.1 class I SAM-dependent methyltransferase [Enterococcus sp.]